MSTARRCIHPRPALDLQAPTTVDPQGRQYIYFEPEDRFLPLIEEGEPPPDEAHYRVAQKLTAAKGGAR